MMGPSGLVLSSKSIYRDIACSPYRLGDGMQTSLELVAYGASLEAD
jgi:hypothetical protein